MVDDLAQARTDYEQGDWTAALDIWSDIEPDQMSADDLHDAALAAYLLGRRDASVDFDQRGFARSPAGWSDGRRDALLLPPRDDLRHRR